MNWYTAFLRKHNLVLEIENLSLVHLRPVVVWDRAFPERVGFVGNAYWDVFFSKNVSDLVIESFRNVRDPKVLPFCVGRLKVSLRVLWAFCLLYTVLSITVKAKDVIECV